MSKSQMILGIMKVVILSTALVLSKHVYSVKADSNLEYKVKAAYLLNFIRYTEWPVGALNDNNPIIICILGKDPFGNILEQAFSGKDISGRNLEVLRIQQIDQSFKNCHAVFMSDLGNEMKRKLLKVINGMPVLTVSDSKLIKTDESIIRFVRFEDTIQFEINLKLAEKAGLKLSSRMIPLAKKVYN